MLLASQRLLSNKQRTHWSGIRHTLCSYCMKVFPCSSMDPQALAEGVQGFAENVYNTVSTLRGAPQPIRFTPLSKAIRSFLRRRFQQCTAYP